MDKIATEKIISIDAYEVSTILGLNPKKTRVEYFYEKTSEVPDHKSNDTKEINNQINKTIGQLFSQLTDQQVIEIPERCVHSEYPMLTGYIPRLVRYSDGTTGPLYAKNLVRFNADTEELPEYIAIHLQMLMSFGFKQASAALLYNGVDLKVFTIDKDEDFIENTLEEISTFYHQNLLGKVPPSPTRPGDYALLYPKHVPGKAIEADTEIAEQIYKLSQIKASISELNKQKELLEDSVKSYIMDNEAITLKGLPAVTYKANSDRTAVNFKKLEKDHPDWVQPYEYTVTGSRVLLIKNIITPSA